MRKYLGVAALFSALSLSVMAAPATLEVQSFAPRYVMGKGPLPYNYRVIDKHIHAGGHPLNPCNGFGNSDKQALAILALLKSRGVERVVDLENTWWIQKRYKKILKKAGMERLHIPMNSHKVPTKEEWLKIKEALREPVYIHCKWGADRTGAILARYLIEEKGYSSKEAFGAVISGGECAGPLGGLKRDRDYFNLVRFFWPQADYIKDVRP